MGGRDGKVSPGPAPPDFRNSAGRERSWFSTTWASAPGLNLVPRLFYLGIAVLAVAELIAALRPLHQSAYAVIFILAFGGALGPSLREARRWAGTHAALWFALAALAARDLIFLQGQIDSAVRAFEALTIGATVIAVRRNEIDGYARHFLLVAASLMLFLFGWVHVTQADTIAGLVPEWVPDRGLVPYFSGAIMIAASVGLWVRPVSVIFAVLVAGMFLSWLPLVHAGRLLANPTDPSEWSFAAMAAVLGTCMIIIATVRRR